MKKTVLLSSLFVLLTVGFLWANGSLAAFSWVETEHNFGKVPQGKPVTATFQFKNQGQSPLVIAHAKGSCGCTGVEYPKEPIMPGASGTIKATFNAAAKGAFNKTVTVESNAETSLVTLQISGEVE